MRKDQKGKQSTHHKGIEDIRVMLIWTLPPNRAKTWRNRGVENLPVRECSIHDTDDESPLDGDAV